MSTAEWIGVLAGGTSAIVAVGRILAVVSRTLREISTIRELIQGINGHPGLAERVGKLERQIDELTAQVQRLADPPPGMRRIR